MANGAPRRGNTKSKASSSGSTNGVIQRRVQLGDDEVVIAKFKGLRALETIALISNLLREMPDLQNKIADFARDFREHNSIQLDFALSRTAAFRGLGLTREDFEASGGTINLPEPPSIQLQMMAMLPEIAATARQYLERLIGIMTIPNSELELADDSDDEDAVDVAIRARGKKIIRNADMDEIMALVAASWDTLEEQFKARPEVAAKLGEVWTRITRSFALSQETTDLETPEPIGEEEDPTPPTSEVNAPSLSTDSPAPTDGTGEPSSMVSPGVN